MKEKNHTRADKTPPRSMANSDHTLCSGAHAIIQKAQEVQNDRILRLPDLTKKVGRAASTIWKDIKDGTFPPQFSIGPRSVGWKESEISAWVEVRAFAARSRRPVDMKQFVSVLVGQCKTIQAAQHSCEN